MDAGWNYEGIGWTAPADGNAVYRLYSGTDHHYTMSEVERDHLISVGWSYEGIGWYSDADESVALYRQFNPNVQPSAPTNNSGSHNYTLSKVENDSLVSAGWNEEGIGWYGINEHERARTCSSARSSSTRLVRARVSRPRCATPVTASISPRLAPRLRAMQIRFTIQASCSRTERSTCSPTGTGTTGASIP